MPGIAPTWTSSDKDLVGTAIGSSRLWFTLGHGIVNEVYFPRIDIPQIRDLGFIVADDAGFWVKVKRGAAYTLTTPAPDHFSAGTGLCCPSLPCCTWVLTAGAMHKRAHG